jgi:enolase
MSRITIQSLGAYQIYDSRGNPTVEAEIRLNNGVRGYGRAPSGASTGQYEALERRDGDAARFQGKSVFNVVQAIETEIARGLEGRDVFDQEALDRALIELDGTQNKSRLGANATLAVSMAACDAAARASSRPLFEYLGQGEGTLLPLPEIQIIGGGAHANWRTDIQDFLIIATGAKSYNEVLEITHNVYHAAGDLLKRQRRYYGLADEGGFWPEFAANEEPLDFLVQAIEEAGYTPGSEAAISLDIAASDLFDPATGRYRLRLDQRSYESAEFIDLMIDWCRRYPVVSLEDPAADTDWAGWQRIARTLGGRVQLVGDDLFTTNVARIHTGIERRAANAVLIKLNQIGTVTETIQAIRLVQRHGWLPIVSARSGETEDAFISHLAVGTNAGQLKVGSFARGERTAKWNEVIRIARELGSRARFLGAEIFKRLTSDRPEPDGRGRTG